MNGWWKFHRKMDRHAVWSLSDSQFKVWISILNLANHQEQDWWNGTERVHILPGSFITSLSHLATYSRTSIKTIRIALGNLSKMGSITAQIRAKRYTQISLVNADIYRCTDVEEDTDQGKVGAQQGHSEGTAGALTGEGKKGRSTKKEKNPRKEILLCNPDGFARFWDVYPKKKNKGRAERAWNKIQPQNGLAETIVASVIDHIQNDQQWEQYQYIPFPEAYLNAKGWEDVILFTHKESTAQRLWREAQEERNAAKGSHGGPDRVV